MSAHSIWQRHFDAQLAIDPESALAFGDWVIDERSGFERLEHVCLAAPECPRDPNTQAA